VRSSSRPDILHSHSSAGAARFSSICLQVSHLELSVTHSTNHFCCACRSFTAGTLHSRPHHLSSSAAAAPLHHGHSSSSSAFAHAAGARTGGSKHHSSGLKHHQKQHELGSSGAAGAGRRSPLQQALHSKHHAAAIAANGGHIGSSGGIGAGVAGLGLAGHVAAGVAGSGGSFTGGQLVPKVQRVMSESVKPETIAKGFAGGMRSRVAAAVGAPAVHTQFTGVFGQQCECNYSKHMESYLQLALCSLRRR
jgi:hypothetical protein